MRTSTLVFLVFILGCTQKEVDSDKVEHVLETQTNLPPGSAKVVAEVISEKLEAEQVAKNSPQQVSNSGSTDSGTREVVKDILTEVKKRDENAFKDLLKFCQIPENERKKKVEEIATSATSKEMETNELAKKVLEEIQFACSGVLIGKVGDGPTHVDEVLSKLPEKWVTPEPSKIEIHSGAAQALSLENSGAPKGSVKVEGSEQLVRDKKGNLYHTVSYKKGKTVAGTAIKMSKDGGKSWQTLDLGTKHSFAQNNLSTAVCVRAGRHAPYGQNLYNNVPSTEPEYYNFVDRGSCTAELEVSFDEIRRSVLSRRTKIVEDEKQTLEDDEIKRSSYDKWYGEHNNSAWVQRQWQQWQVNYPGRPYTEFEDSVIKRAADLFQALSSSYACLQLRVYKDGVVTKGNTYQTSSQVKLFPDPDGDGIVVYESNYLETSTQKGVCPEGSVPMANATSNVDRESRVNEATNAVMEAREAARKSFRIYANHLDQTSFQLYQLAKEKRDAAEKEFNALTSTSDKKEDYYETWKSADAEARNAYISWKTWNKSNFDESERCSNLKPAPSDCHIFYYPSYETVEKRYRDAEALERFARNTWEQAAGIDVKSNYLMNAGLSSSQSACKSGINHSTTIVSSLTKYVVEGGQVVSRISLKTDENTLPPPEVIWSGTYNPVTRAIQYEIVGGTPSNLVAMRKIKTVRQYKSNYCSAPQDEDVKTEIDTVLFQQGGKSFVTLGSDNHIDGIPPQTHLRGMPPYARYDDPWIETPAHIGVPTNNKDAVYADNDKGELFYATHWGVYKAIRTQPIEWGKATNFSGWDYVWKYGAPYKSLGSSQTKWDDTLKAWVYVNFPQVVVHPSNHQIATDMVFDGDGNLHLAYIDRGNAYHTFPENTFNKDRKMVFYEFVPANQLKERKSRTTKVEFYYLENCDSLCHAAQSFFYQNNMPPVQNPQTGEVASEVRAELLAMSPSLAGNYSGSIVLIYRSDLDKPILFRIGSTYDRLTLAHLSEFPFSEYIATRDGNNDSTSAYAVPPRLLDSHGRHASIQLRLRGDARPEIVVGTPLSITTFSFKFESDRIGVRWDEEVQELPQKEDQVYSEVPPIDFSKTIAFLNGLHAIYRGVTTLSPAVENLETNVKGLIEAKNKPYKKTSRVSVLNKTKMCLANLSYGLGEKLYDSVVGLPTMLMQGGKNVYEVNRDFGTYLLALAMGDEHASKFLEEELAKQNKWADPLLEGARKYYFYHAKTAMFGPLSSTNFLLDPEVQQFLVQSFIEDPLYIQHLKSTTSSIYEIIAFLMESYISQYYKEDYYQMSEAEQIEFVCHSSARITFDVASAIVLFFQAKDGAVKLVNATKEVFTKMPKHLTSEIASAVSKTAAEGKAVTKLAQAPKQAPVLLPDEVLAKEGNEVARKSLKLGLDLRNPDEALVLEANINRNNVATRGRLKNEIASLHRLREKNAGSLIKWEEKAEYREVLAIGANDRYDPSVAGIDFGRALNIDEIKQISGGNAHRGVPTDELLTPELTKQWSHLFNDEIFENCPEAAKMTVGEALAVNDYTSGFPSNQMNGYIAFGRDKISGVDKLFDMKVRLLSSAYHKLKPYRGRVYRGGGVTTSELDAMRTPGSRIAARTFWSTSEDVRIVGVHDGLTYSHGVQRKTEQIHQVIYIIQSKSGRYVSHLTNAGLTWEREVLFRPGTTFRVAAFEENVPFGRILTAEGSAASSSLTEKLVTIVKLVEE